jgi:hypothetical protein
MSQSTRLAAWSIRAILRSVKILKAKDGTIFKELKLSHEVIEE